jgi:hypothetical protein
VVLSFLQDELSYPFQVAGHIRLSRLELDEARAEEAVKVVFDPLAWSPSR